VIDAIREFIRFLERRGDSVKLYCLSVVHEQGSIFFLIRKNRELKIVVIRSPPEPYAPHDRFIAEENGGFKVNEVGFEYRICPCSHANALELRKLFPFTRPLALDLIPAMGTGDRIGLSTPGHIRAVRKFHILPVLAQQSAREMARTGRTPREVIDDVSWAVFQEGYKDGFSADADHLKDQRDIEDAFEAGFTMYTIDPSDYVDDKADEYDLKTMEKKLLELPWDDLKSDESKILEIYLGRKFRLSHGDQALELEFLEEELLRIMVKYSPAIAQTAKLETYLEALFGGSPFDLEVSFDETKTPTSALEHFYIASELKRLNIHVQSLAVHFVGKFEKAIDYVGDLKEFERTLREHVIIARSCGPYKLSIHSGSDKLSIYPIIGRLTGGLFHLKTAGTSYLEALRIIARLDPFLFREIINYSMGCFERDKKTYQISTELSSIPRAQDVKDEDLERVFLEGNPGRQLLHVTFGSILTARGSDGDWLFRDRVRRILIDNEEEHYRTIATHFECYLKSLGVERKTS
jgi:hypothetical protein